MSARSKLLASCGGAPTDTYFRDVTLLLHGDGSNGAQNNTFLDSSTNNFTITRNGNTTQGSFSPYGSLWSNYFDGTNYQYLSVANNTALDLPSSTAFTIEAWIFPTRPNNGAQSGFRNIVAKRVPNSLTSNYNIMLWYNSEKIGFFNGSTSSLSSGSIPQNAWTHFAYVYDGVSSLKLYINGTLDSTFATTPGATNSTAVTIGSLIDDTGGQNNFGGQISNLRIVKGAQVYTSNFTPPNAPLTAISGISLLTCQSNRFIDNSANNFTITRNGDVKVTNFAPFAPSAAYAAGTNGGSAYFDGTGDYLNSSATALGSGAFTVECWFYATATMNYCTLWSTDDGSNSASGIRLVTGPNDNTLVIGVGGSAVLTSSSTFSLNTWNHAAVVRSGTTITLYLNGVSVGTLTNSTNFSLTNMIVGRYGNAYYWTGYISNLRAVVGTAVYTGTFTPPTAPVTAITNTSLLLNATNAAIFDNSMKNDLETVGNAQISTSVKKFGTGSISLNGTTDYLRTYSRDLLSFGTGDFTIEAWVYPTSVASIYATFIEARSTNVAQAYACGLRNSGGVYKVEMYTGTQYLGSITVNTNTWTHVAISRSSGTLRIFVNGTLDTSWSSVTTSVDANGASQLIGVLWDGSGTYFPGYIDDFRITKGVARYTANFTPPAAAFPNQ